MKVFPSGRTGRDIFLHSVLLLAALIWCGVMSAERYYVSPRGAGDGSSWQSPTTLDDALSKAKANDEIWVQGFASTDRANYYVAPADGFTLRSGVRLYGGFAGTEATLGERDTDGRAFGFTCRTVLSGDISGNDDVTGHSSLIFPENNTRADNAVHVLTLDLEPTDESANNNRYATVVNGFTIAGGHADGENGGGIYVKGSKAAGAGAYRIERCFFTDNYGGRGGAVYVDANAVGGADPSLISQCAMFNNAAGHRAVEENAGGAVCLDGYGVVVNTSIFNNENGGILMADGCRVVNSTVTRNTGSGISISGSSAEVWNTVVWGNDALFDSGSTSPHFHHSAYPEVTADDANNNIRISVSNRETGVASPHFESPSTRAGYDVEYRYTHAAYPLWAWALLEGSALIDRGDDNAYNDDNGTSPYGTFDLALASRFSGTVDIGAYEFQPTPAGRILRVAPDGSDANDGSSWSAAFRSVQAAIDRLASTGNGRGEVWVKAGTYSPTSLLASGDQLTAAFIMRDGVSVYGGFAGKENSRAERKLKLGGMPWEFENVTVFQASGYMDAASWNAADLKWSIVSSSNHVVWFDGTEPVADGYKDFSTVTVLDGVTVCGGRASLARASVYCGDRGAGLYMDNANARLVNCIVTQNVAEGPGGGVYLGGGRIESSLLFNNSSDADGGAVYVDNSGLVLRSMLTNNAAGNGAAVCLARNGDYTDGDSHPEYLILSTSVVSNNTARKNGAVYCDEGGVLTQNTIVNNSAPRALDATDPEATRTGGLFIDGYALVINNILWNNRANGTGVAGNDIPMYAANPTQSAVRFLSSAVSGMNNAVWNNTLQQSLTSLAASNTGTEGENNPDFSVGGAMSSDDALNTTVGVQPSWTAIDYFWQPQRGSNLRAVGMTLASFPDEVLLAPELDIAGLLFSHKPSVGAHMIEQQSLSPERDGNVWRLYVDGNCTEPEHDGSSWATAYRSLNEAIDYFSSLSETDVAGVTRFEIYVYEGSYYPRYAFTGNDAKTATVSVKRMPGDRELVIRGGWSRDDVPVYNPVLYRTVLDGNPDGSFLEEGLYHVFTVESGAHFTLDGFHVVGGYATGSSPVQYGAGMLVGDGAVVTLRNSFFENNTAVSGAAVDARGATLTLENCVINNNTNTASAEPVVNAGTLTLNHVTVVRNVGVPYSSGANVTNSFAAGNVDAAEGGSSVSGNTLTFTGGWNTVFANPTNVFGAALGFDTYVGGYADFTPLTSSAEASHLINKGTASASTVDIAQRPRNLGGTPDLGAYEADLPEKGRVYYVRENGDDLNDGLSWNTAFQTIRMAVETAAKGEVIDGARPSVWVAAGNYAQDPLSGSNNCFDMADGVSVYGSFPKTGNPNMDERHPFISDVIYHDGTYSSADYETILRPATATNDVRRVLGQSDEYNPFMYVHPNYTEQTTSYVYVGAGNGDYDYSYTEQSGGGWIYSEKDGGFVDASADAADRLFHVTAPGYYPVDQADTPTHKYVTSVERTAYSGWNLDRWDPDGWGTGLDEKTFVYVGSGKGDYVITEESKGGWPYGDYSRYASNDNGDYVEFHEEDYYECVADVATHKYFSEGYHEVASRELWNTVRLVKGWNYVGSGHGTHSRGEIANVGNGSYKSVTASGKHFLYATVWDGFTIRDGYLNSDKIKFLGSNDHGVGGTRNGGAGVVLFSNVTLRNSVVYGSQNVSGSKPLRGGGIYCDGGSIVNCYILNSELRFNGTGEAYGGGCYMYSGTAYNCVINGNQTYGGSTDGAGIFIENAEFYNNTIVGNRSNGSARGNGGICIWQSGSSSKLTIYNCIVLGNEGYRQGTNNPIYGNKDIARQAGTIESYNSIFETTVNATGVVYDPTCKAVGSGNMNSIFAGYDGKNFRLAGGSPALNMGENVPQVNGKDIVLLDYTDMDFSDRIKDCTVDAGAYELDNKENISPDNNGVYYVTIDGSGLANGSSPENAACEMKLQDILDAAGERAAGGQTAEVRIAGYKGAAADGYIYNATDLSDPDDPMSYTFTVPYGVTVKGGYDVDFDETTRDVLTYHTVLSPVATKGGQTVNGYHVVTFDMEKHVPSNYQQAGSIIDGLYLVDGRATSLAGAGNDDTRGGGAIVPAGAHVRNCVVMNNEAKSGGGLYLLPGAMVSGTVLRDNTAAQGGGLYAEADEAGSTRSHMVSVTVGGNSATSAGGGIYMEDGALMVLNSVVHGNEAPTDLNVSGVVSEEYEDGLIADVLGAAAGTKFFPFNNSFVETYEMPSNLGNMSMESDASLYFTGSRYTLKVYSELIKHGGTAEVQTKLEESYGVAAEDMQGVPRRQGTSDRIDAGAYAFEGEIMEVDDDVAYTLFVSQSENVEITDKDAAAAFYGRSFFTSLTWLDDALEYIRQVRGQGKADHDRTFRILMSGGTYKPHFARSDANAPGHDQRLNSFEIPCNVEIYGGFSGKEQLTSYVGTAYNINSILGQELEVVADDLSSVLGKRAYSDLNQNGVMEEYEFANQTILSGELEASEDESNVYHVIYSDVADNVDVPEGKHTVKIDGVTVMGGVTHNELSPTGEENEVGRGGGIYSNGVNYVVNRCRLINNRAVHGGAVFVRDAMLSLVGSIVAGNSSVENAAGTADNHVGGGAVYLIGLANDPSDEMSVLAAANTIFANNETSGHGGAIAAHGSEWQTGGTVYSDPIISMTNCMFVNNKAAEGEAAIYNTNDKSKALNTVFWGNVSGGDEHGKTIELIHCASDEIDNTDNGNVILAKENLSIDGPRFAQPSVAAGIAGNSAVSRWNPASISVLTDAGDGLLAEGVDDMSQATGGYAEWMQTNLPNYAYQYMSYDGYSRYDGPLNEDGSKGDKPIDIGVYEYQYDVDFSTLDTVYVALEESGTGSGTSWDNATSDLRGALIGLANSTGGTSEDKAVLIKEGDYTNSRLYSLAGVGGVLYTINMSTDEQVMTKNLTVSGSYTESGQQDFSRPTVIMVADGAAKPDVLMNVDAQGKTVTLRGLTFDGSGAAQSVIGLHSEASGNLSVKNVAFRHNATGAAVSGGTALFANALFADNATVGLSVTGGDATVVNATFANNGDAITGAANVYNSISWQSGNGITTDEANHNYDFGTADNADVMNGPNFVDPANGDYTIRPSKNILNKGSNDLYSTHVGVSPTADKDLANLPRLTGDAIDLGAYEYGAPLQQLLYVRHDVVGGNADGTSWDNAIGDLQSAVDLAALYTEANEGNAYVFADRNVKSVAVNLAISDVKVYGGMNNEVAAGENDDDKAASLISQRDGVIAADGRSTIDDLTVSAASLFDGFEVKAADVTDGAMLSTSVVGNVTVDGGTVYNSYVEGTAGGNGSYVNVTSPGELPEGADNINNYPSAVANGYVNDDIWTYQPKETYENIDKAEESVIADCMTFAGHRCDLSGSQRVRNGKVDYGCFELWNITANTTVQDADRPSDRHVVYVREGIELGLGDGLYGAGSEFNPGFLLLEHGAGLLGNGNSVALTNFAVERNLTEANAYTDLASMPFTIEKTEVDGKEGLDGVTVSRYDGAARAAYDYRYDGENSAAWVALTDLKADRVGMEGLLLEADTDAKVRFYGNDYKEDAGDKAFVLTQHNHAEPWSSPDAVSERFTHAENMGWNLFGSPFLCTMNYEDMDYQRVIYVYKDKYISGLPTWNRETGDVQDGNIPAGSAVFTQTATLASSETVPVGHRAADVTEAAVYAGNLAVEFARADAGDEADADLIQITAVPAAESKNGFDVNADGVKWMNGKADVPQIYMLRDGGRYSLLSAVDIDGSVAVGVSVSAPGNFEFRIPDDCDTYDYEVVVLKDAQLGTLTDLKEVPCSVYLPEAGEVNSRFSISFRRIDETSVLDGVQVYTPYEGMFTVEGMRGESVIRYYDASGRMIEQRRSSSYQETFRAVRGVYLVEVECEGMEHAVIKVLVK